MPDTIKMIAPARLMVAFSPRRAMLSANANTASNPKTKMYATLMSLRFMATVWHAAPTPKSTKTATLGHSLAKPSEYFIHNPPQAKNMEARTSRKSAIVDITLTSRAVIT